MTDPGYRIIGKRGMLTCIDRDGNARPVRVSKPHGSALAAVMTQLAPDSGPWRVIPAENTENE